jgi:hypothetical protein
VISSAHLGAIDSSGFKNGTAPHGLRHASRGQATAKHYSRGVWEDFYRAADARGAAFIERVAEVPNNLENVESRLHPAMQASRKFRRRRGKDAYAEGLKLLLDCSQLAA